MSHMELQIILAIQNKSLGLMIQKHSKNTLVHK